VFCFFYLFFKVIFGEKKIDKKKFRIYKVIEKEIYIER